MRGRNGDSRAKLVKLAHFGGGVLGSARAVIGAGENMCMKIKIDRILGHSRPPPSVTSFLCQYFITYIRQCQSQKAKNRAAAQMRGSPLYISSVMVYHRRMIRIGLITAEPRPA